MIQRDMFYTGRERQNMSHPVNPPTPEKKKHFRLLGRVKDFLRNQSGDVKQEFNSIVWALERDEYLNYPYGEKVEGEDIFAIRVVQAGNIRVFYVYGSNDRV